MITHIARNLRGCGSPSSNVRTWAIQEHKTTTCIKCAILRIDYRENPRAAVAILNGRSTLVPSY